MGYKSYKVGSIPHNMPHYNFLRKWFASQLENLVANEPDALSRLHMLRVDKLSDREHLSISYFYRLGYHFPPHTIPQNRRPNQFRF